MYDAFYSDPHFGHKNIIKYAERPFDNVEEMNETLIENYNANVRHDQLVLWLGDCFFQPKNKAKETLHSLNGKKHLIIGNHDKSIQSMLDIGFDAVFPLEVFVKIRDRRVRCTHYPYWHSEKPGWHVDDRYEKERPPYVKGELLMHGHTHHRDRVNQTQIHVGVDAWDYNPVLREHVDELIAWRFPNTQE